MADKTDIPAVGEPKRLGVIGVHEDYCGDVYAHFGQNVKELRRESDSVYYLVEHDSFAEMTGHAVIPFYSFFVDPYCLKGVWANTPFGVAWDSNGVRIVENQPNN